MRHSHEDSISYMLLMTLHVWSRLCEPHKQQYAGQECWWIDWLDFIPSSSWSDADRKVVENGWCTHTDRIRY